MDFDYDIQHSETNLAKHGIDFKRAQALWDDPNLLEIPVKTDDKARWLLIGKIEDQCWSAIVTYRADLIRIISIRRSRTDEVTLYES